MVEFKIPFIEYSYKNLIFKKQIMNKQIINFGYMLAWVLVATLILNPTTAYKIKSNLVAWFQAITSSSVKNQNNLVWLDAGWKLPLDILPANAATTWSNWMYFCQTTIIWAGSSTATVTCPALYSKMEFKWPAHWHEAMFTTPNWSNKTSFNSAWNQYYNVSTLCCVKN